MEEALDQQLADSSPEMNRRVSFGKHADSSVDSSPEKKDGKDDMSPAKRLSSAEMISMVRELGSRKHEIDKDYRKLEAKYTFQYNESLKVQRDFEALQDNHKELEENYAELEKFSQAQGNESEKLWRNFEQLQQKHEELQENFADLEKLSHAQGEKLGAEVERLQKIEREFADLKQASEEKRVENELAESERKRLEREREQASERENEEERAREAADKKRIKDLEGLVQSLESTLMKCNMQAEVKAIPENGSGPRSNCARPRPEADTFAVLDDDSPRKKGQVAGLDVFVSGDDFGAENPLVHEDPEIALHEVGSGRGRGSDEGEAEVMMALQQEIGAWEEESKGLSRANRALSRRVQELEVQASEDRLAHEELRSCARKKGRQRALLSCAQGRR